jgi:hypothetical protein
LGNHATRFCRDWVSCWGFIRSGTASMIASMSWTLLDSRPLTCGYENRAWGRV